MRAILILLLTCACFLAALVVSKPVVLADPGNQILPAGAKDDNIDSEKVREFHLVKAERFVAVNGFGARRVISMFDLKHFPLAKTGSDEYWELVSIDVVGHARTRPRTYMTKQIVNREKLNDIPTRALDAFETRGLDALRKQVAAKQFASVANAEAAHWQREGDRLRVLGSLRATQSCLECHKAKEGELLGALSYTLKAVAKVSVQREVWWQDLTDSPDTPASIQAVREPQGYLKDYPQVQATVRKR